MTDYNDASSPPEGPPSRRNGHRRDVDVRDRGPRGHNGDKDHRTTPRSTSNNIDNPGVVLKSRAAVAAEQREQHSEGTLISSSGGKPDTGKDHQATSGEEQPAGPRRSQPARKRYEPPKSPSRSDGADRRTSDGRGDRDRERPADGDAGTNSDSKSLELCEAKPREDQVKRKKSNSKPGKTKSKKEKKRKVERRSPSRSASDKQAQGRDFANEPKPKKSKKSKKEKRRESSGERAAGDEKNDPKSSPKSPKSVRSGSDNENYGASPSEKRKSGSSKEAKRVRRSDASRQTKSRRDEEKREKRTSGPSKPPPVRSRSASEESFVRSKVSSEDKTKATKSRRVCDKAKANSSAVPQSRSTPAVVVLGQDKNVVVASNTRPQPDVPVREVDNRKTTIPEGNRGKAPTLKARARSSSSSRQRSEVEDRQHKDKVKKQGVSKLRSESRRRDVARVDERTTRGAAGKNVNEDIGREKQEKNGSTHAPSRADSRNRRGGDHLHRLRPADAGAEGDRRPDKEMKGGGKDSNNDGRGGDRARDAKPGRRADSRQRRSRSPSDVDGGCVTVKSSRRQDNNMSNMKKDQDRRGYDEDVRRLAETGAEGKTSRRGMDGRGGDRARDAKPGRRADSRSRGSRSPSEIDDGRVTVNSNRRQDNINMKKDRDRRGYDEGVRRIADTNAAGKTSSRRLDGGVGIPNRDDRYRDDKRDADTFATKTSNRWRMDGDTANHDDRYHDYRRRDTDKSAAQKTSTRRLVDGCAANDRDDSRYRTERMPGYKKHSRSRSQENRRNVSDRMPPGGDPRSGEGERTSRTKKNTDRERRDTGSSPSLPRPQARPANPPSKFITKKSDRVAVAFLPETQKKIGFEWNNNSSAPNGQRHPQGSTSNQRGVGNVNGRGGSSNISNSYNKPSVSKDQDHLRGIGAASGGGSNNNMLQNAFPGVFESQRSQHKQKQLEDEKRTEKEKARAFGEDEVKRKEQGQQDSRPPNPETEKVPRTPANEKRRSPRVLSSTGAEQDEKQRETPAVIPPPPPPNKGPAPPAASSHDVPQTPIEIAKEHSGGHIDGRPPVVDKNVTAVPSDKASPHGHGRNSHGTVAAKALQPKAAAPPAAGNKSNAMSGNTNENDRGKGNNSAATGGHIQPPTQEFQLRGGGFGGKGQSDGAGKGKHGLPNPPPHHQAPFPGGTPATMPMPTPLPAQFPQQPAPFHSQTAGIMGGPGTFQPTAPGNQNMMNLQQATGPIPGSSVDMLWKVQNNVVLPIATNAMGANTFALGANAMGTNAPMGATQWAPTGVPPAAATTTSGPGGTTAIPKMSGNILQAPQPQAKDQDPTSEDRDLVMGKGTNFLPADRTKKAAAGEPDFSPMGSQAPIAPPVDTKLEMDELGAGSSHDGEAGVMRKNESASGSGALAQGDEEMSPELPKIPSDGVVPVPQQMPAPSRQQTVSEGDDHEQRRDRYENRSSRQQKYQEARHNVRLGSYDEDDEDDIKRALEDYNLQQRKHSDSDSADEDESEKEEQQRGREHAEQEHKYVYGGALPRSAKTQGSREKDETALEMLEQVDYAYPVTAFKDDVRFPGCKSLFWKPNPDKPVTGEAATALFQFLRDNIQWTERNWNHDVAWYTVPEMKVKYGYGKNVYDPVAFPPWMYKLREQMMHTLRLPMDDPPHGCNINLYKNGSAQLGAHSDDEAIFDGIHSAIRIVSFSLGEPRSFHILDKYKQFLKAIVLPALSYMTMEGNFQRDLKHMVPAEPEKSQPRINITWRWVLKPDGAAADQQAALRSATKFGGKGMLSGKAHQQRNAGGGGRGIYPQWNPNKGNSKMNNYSSAGEHHRAGPYSSSQQMQKPILSGREHQQNRGAFHGHNDNRHSASSAASSAAGAASQDAGPPVHGPQRNPDMPSGFQQFPLLKPRQPSSPGGGHGQNASGRNYSNERRGGDRGNNYSSFGGGNARGGGGYGGRDRDGTGFRARDGSGRRGRGGDNRREGGGDSFRARSHDT